MLCDEEDYAEIRIQKSQLNVRCKRKEETYNATAEVFKLLQSRMQIVAGWDWTQSPLDKATTGV
jgi:hypothetical protein